MPSVLANLIASFGFGITAPLFAVCVLPLYPGFIAYLASKLDAKASKKTFVILGLLVMAGVLVSMLLIGLVFVTLLQESFTMAIEIVSPIAFLILALISILLIFNVDLGKFFPQVHAPVVKNPKSSSFLFGLFFGAIVLPCNPGPLIVLFTLSSSTADVVANFLNFVMFGIGMGLPLLIFAVISGIKSKQVIGFLTKHKKAMNRIIGIIMLAISLYLLIFDFGDLWLAPLRGK